MILKPLELIYQSVTSLKNFLYDRHVLRSIRISVPVISVGNLSFGGTGKTPFIVFLVEELEKSLRINVICKSYRAQLKNPARVDLQRPDAAAYYGDEPCLLQSKLLQSQVWSGPQKFKTAQASLIEKPSLVVVDDGFSHRRLERQFDIVLFDATQLGANYNRESLASLSRAHAVVLTKASPSTQDRVQQFKELVSKQFAHLKNSVFDSDVQASVDLPQGSTVYAFCGIARPESFSVTLKNLGFQIHFFEGFKDHQIYSEKFQIDILNKFKKLKTQQSNVVLVTTEKDFIKITNPTLRALAKCVRFQIAMDNQQKERLLEKIRSIS